MEQSLRNYREGFWPRKSSSFMSPRQTGERRLNDGILELEDGGLRVTLIKAVVRATERAKELLEK